MKTPAFSTVLPMARLESFLPKLVAVNSMLFRTHHLGSEQLRRSNIFYFISVFILFFLPLQSPAPLTSSRLLFVGFALSSFFKFYSASTPAKSARKRFPRFRANIMLDCFPILTLTCPYRNVNNLLPCSKKSAILKIRGGSMRQRLPRWRERSNF